MIVRIAQIKGLTSHSFVCEYLGEDNEWHYSKTPCYYLKNAKVRYNKENIVFLVGHTFSNDKERQRFQDKHFAGQAIDWNDNVSQYAYVEWVDFYEAYC